MFAGILRFFCGAISGGHTHRGVATWPRILATATPTWSYRLLCSGRKRKTEERAFTTKALKLRKSNLKRSQRLLTNRRRHPSDSSSLPAAEKPKLGKEDK